MRRSLPWVTLGYIFVAHHVSAGLRVRVTPA